MAMDESFLLKQTKLYYEYNTIIVEEYEWYYNEGNIKNKLTV